MQNIHGRSGSGSGKPLLNVLTYELEHENLKKLGQDSLFKV